MTPMDWATRVIQWKVQRAATERSRANPQNFSQSGSKIETHLREIGIVSNRRSEHYGELVPGASTHCPSMGESKLGLK